VPNMFGGDQFDELYAPHMNQRTTPPSQPDANPEQGLVTDEENERFSPDVSNFKDASEAASCAKDLGNCKSEAKYLDQINDACTELYNRRKTLNNST